MRKLKDKTRPQEQKDTYRRSEMEFLQRNQRFVSRMVAADPRTLADELAASPERIAATVRELLAAGKITTGSNGKLEIIA